MQGTGWDVVALSDKHPDYAGSCGKCYEVRDCCPEQHLPRTGLAQNCCLAMLATPSLALEG